MKTHHFSEEEESEKLLLQLADGNEGGKKFLAEQKGAKSFNSLPTSVYLEKKPLCHSVILSFVVASIQAHSDRSNKAAP